LGVEAHVTAGADDKVRALESYGANRCVAIGNGANDTEMLAAAALGIAVVGPEGASSAALAAGDVVCNSIVDALDLLIEPRLLIATLRT
jgi:soluble P-type ATPase